MSLLGLDVGDKRVGVAISHSEVLASEYLTLEQNEEIVAKILDICQKEDVEKIIVGLPIASSGQEESQAKKVRQFIKTLQLKINTPIILENETLTTLEAEQILQDEGFSVSQAKERVDQLSAKLILQQYLERQSLKKRADFSQNTNL